MDATLEWDGETPADRVAMFQEFTDALPQRLEAAVEEISLRVMRSAQRLVNVDTGRLRSSIKQESERIATHTVRAIVGSNVEYAPFHEMDYPYLRPAFEQNRQFIRERIATAVESAWDGVIT
ncbi:HK97 gp10 family phage protein [Halostella sp. PRR32]|uniref:HK97 gp10 family phage protein n=1 Tax=Halostella sp. PRR32 TaxID=3098147 RepID=UPI002B1D048C|nr:HK97 gp10 family phage protein [Halostella sp. PRR32]